MILIIVESPNKSKHITSLLNNSSYRVRATLGHLLDLPKKELGISIEDQFKPQWQVITGKTDTVAMLRAEAQKAESIIIATDPDREGEGIAQHVVDLLPKSSHKKITRAEFNEITKQGIERGLNNTRPINTNLVLSQQTRRIFDRLIGFMISPKLWRHLKGAGISAGRVQSCALALIKNRQDIIDSFVSKNYWTIKARFSDSEDRIFEADLIEWNECSTVDVPFLDAIEVDRCLEELKHMKYQLLQYQREPKAYNPPAPFITTSLLSTASSHLGFDSKYTLKVAQQLFEGVDLGSNESHGLITYMRTDSPRVSREAQELTRIWVEANLGSHLLPEKPITHKSTSTNVQDAHECIRPTDVNLTPEKVRPYLSKEQYKLYHLIFWRFIMSQLAPAIHDEVTITIQGTNGSSTAIFRAFASQLIEKGWRTLLEDTAAKEHENTFDCLTTLASGDVVDYVEGESLLHKTKAPKRYTEASLIRELERLGVGRPSTYGHIIGHLIAKKYIFMSDKLISITPLGVSVVMVLERSFPQILDAQFTAQMESQLDQVAIGSLNWLIPVNQIYHEIINSKFQ